MNDGGPAFPHSTLDNGVIHCQPGMALRDYFAANAMQGILAHLGCLDTADMKRADGVYLGVTAAQGISKAAYGYADAMLKAREVES